ncbi:unnamed protein product, partial [Polarella glacialis]
FNMGCSETGAAKLGLVTVVDTYTLKLVGTVFAHRSPVQALCLNPTGQLLATASCRGTVVRVFGVPALDMLFSFRRGASSCRILGLNFSRDSAHICAPSAGGTVHIFKNSERLLSELPLQSEEATIGAALREIGASKSGNDAAAEAAFDSAKVPTPPVGLRPCVPSAPVMLQPKENPNEAKAEAPASDGEPQSTDDEPEVEDDFGEWNLIVERPERLLELCVNPPSSYAFTPSSCSRAASAKNALQTLSAVSEFAVGNTAKYAKSLLQLLPQPCRELVDAPRAFAWVHLRDEEDPRDVRKLHSAGMCLQAVLGSAAQAEELRPQCGSYIACLSTTKRANGSPGRAEVLVASPVRGCAHVYEWSTTVGGECRLRTEHSFTGLCHRSPPPEPPSAGGVTGPHARPQSVAF